MRTFLFILVAFVALTASLSGLLLITNTDGSIFHLPVSLLRGTPFKDFLFPGILLTLIVGGSNILAFSHFLQKDRLMYNAAITGGIMLTVWILAQMIVIPATSWIQIFYLGIGVLIILLSFQLKGKWIV